MYWYTGLYRARAWERNDYQEKRKDGGGGRTNRCNDLYSQYLFDIATIIQLT